MFSSDKEEKEKKRKKRLSDVLFHIQAGRLRDNIDVGAPSEEKKAERPVRSVKNEDYTKKLATVHKSLALRRREANDRWNRFAGTSGGGGRGL